MQYDRTLLRSLATAVTIALLCASVAAVAGPSMAEVSPDESTLSTASSSSGSSVAAADDGDIAVSLRYGIAPDDPERYSVEVTLDNVPSEDEYAVELNYRDRIDGTPQGFTRDPDDSDVWIVEDDASEHTMTIEREFDENGAMYESNSTALPDTYEIGVLRNGISWHNTRYEHEASTGIVADGDVCLGCDVGTATADDVTVTIAGDRSRMADSPQAIADSIAQASTQMETLSPDEDVVGFAVTEIDRLAGVASGNSFMVEEQLGVQADTWVHEYAHTVQAQHLGNDMSWYKEGWAEYAGYLYSLEAETISYQQFERGVSRDRPELSVLSNQSTWDVDSSDDRYNNEYYQGARVLAAIDREIRRSTGGEKTLEDVDRRMLQSETAVDLDQYRTMIADVAGNETASKAVTWITSDDEADLPDSDVQYAKGHDPVEGVFPKDVGGDGHHRDISADGTVTNADVRLFYQYQHTSKIDDYPEFYDYNGDGDVGQADTIALFEYVNG